jgi:hypothetical protein
VGENRPPMWQLTPLGLCCSFASIKASWGQERTLTCGVGEVLLGGSWWLLTGTSVLPVFPSQLGHWGGQHNGEAWEKVPSMVGGLEAKGVVHGVRIS